MKLDRYTEKAQEAILAAQRLATEAQSPILDAEHIAAALLQDEEGIPAATLRRLDADPAGVAVDLAGALSNRARIQGGQLSLDPRGRYLIERAEENTRGMLQGMLGSLGYTDVNVIFAPTVGSADR